MMSFNKSLDEHVQSLAAYLPNGKLFEAKNIQDSNFRQLLRGLSGEIFNAQGYLATLENEYIPSLTTLFIEEWERALGIPDECAPGSGTITERRRDIVVKLASLGVQTAEDFVALAALYGIVVTVTPLSDESPTLPVGVSEVEARYIFVVTGPGLTISVPPYDVPFNLFGDETILQCLINRQAPSNCAVIYRNT